MADRTLCPLPLLALFGLTACESSTVVGYNTYGLPLGVDSCPATAPLRACSTENCVVTGIGEAEIGVEAMAVDSDDIFFISSFNVLGKKPIGGGPTVELDTDLNQVMGLTIDADHVYWSEYDGELFRVPKAGGSRSQVAKLFGHPVFLVADDENLYVVLTESGEVAMVSKRSGEATVLGGQDGPVAIALDAENVYWVNQGPAGASNGQLVRAPRGNLTGAEVVLSKLKEPLVVGVTADALLWATHDNAYRAPKAGGSPITIRGSFAEPKGIAEFDGNVYVVAYGGLQRFRLEDRSQLVLDGRPMSSMALGCDGVFATGWADPVLIRFGQ